MKRKLAIIVNCLICIWLLCTFCFIARELIDDPAMTPLGKQEVILCPDEVLDVAVDLEFDMEQMDYVLGIV